MLSMIMRDSGKYKVLHAITDVLAMAVEEVLLVAAEALEEIPEMEDTLEMGATMEVLVAEVAVLAREVRQWFQIFLLKILWNKGSMKLF